MQELFELIQATGFGLWEIGGESDERKGWVTINAPDHMEFAEIVLRMEDDEEDTPSCLQKAKVLALLFKNIDKLVQAYHDRQALLDTLDKLNEVYPLSTAQQARVDAELIRIRMAGE